MQNYWSRLRVCGIHCCENRGENVVVSGGIFCAWVDGGY